MPAIISGIGTALPPYSMTQNEVLELIQYKRNAFRSVFLNSGIEKRHFCLEPGTERPHDANSFANYYERWAPRLAVEAARNALTEAHAQVGEIEHVIVASCTGYLCPGLSQIVARELGLKSKAKNTNLLGMGCSAMIPALDRARDYALSHAGTKSLVIAVEISSSAFWHDENDLESAVGNAIFADGASAAVVEGRKGKTGERELCAFASFSDRELLHYMGFYSQDGRLRVRLSRDVPGAIVSLIDSVVSELCPGGADVSQWIVHPGGKRILEVVGERFQLTDRLGASWRVLSQCGNMSSATLLFVLQETERSKTPRSGDTGLMIGIGPGLTCEGALIRWC